MGQEQSLPSLKEFCALESFNSKKCLERQNFDREKCGTEFLEYRACKARWNEYRVSYRRAIEAGTPPPSLPPHVLNDGTGNAESKDRSKNSKNPTPRTQRSPYEFLREKAKEMDKQEGERDDKENSDAEIDQR